MRKSLIHMEKELNKFREKFSSLSPNAIPLEFLKQAQVYGFYIGDELVAGYALNTEAPYRYVSWIPEGSEKDFVYNKFYKNHQAVETACLWMSKRDTKKLQQNLVYFHLITDLLKTGQRYILAGTTANKIGSKHKDFIPNVIYHGELALPGAPEGEVYYATPLEVAKSFYKRFVTETISDISQLIKKTFK